MKRLLWVLLFISVSPFSQAELHDNGDGTITDTATGLMWLKNANMVGQKTFEQAKQWAEGLDFAGHSDWRLPTGQNPDGTVCNSRPNGASCTQTEFATLYFGHLIMTFNQGPFENIVGREYWTSTEWPADASRAMAQDFEDGGQLDEPKTHMLGAWAVRGTLNNVTTQLRIDKIVVGGGAPASGAQFDLRVDGVVVAPGVGDQGSTGFLIVSPGTHTISESASSGTNLSNYVATFGGACDASGQVTLAPGEHKVCVITNTRRGSLVVRKLFLPATDPGRVDLLVDGRRRASDVGNNGSTGRISLPAGRHWAFELPSVAPSSRLPAKQMYSFKQFLAYKVSFAGACDGNGVVLLNPGDTKVCTIQNTRRAQPLSVAQCNAACRQFANVCSTGGVMSGFASAAFCQSQERHCSDYCDALVPRLPTP